MPTDDLLKFRRKEILNNSGSISHQEAVEKAEKEYEKFRVIQDQKYISSMDEFYKKYLNENKCNWKNRDILIKIILVLVLMNNLLKVLSWYDWLIIVSEKPTVIIWKRI